MTSLTPDFDVILLGYCELPAAAAVIVVPSFFFSFTLADFPHKDHPGPALKMKLCGLDLPHLSTAMN